MTAGGLEADAETEEQKEFLADMRHELAKFGPVQSLKLASDPSDENFGKVLVSYHNLSSAFVCYNLLNGKNYMDHPVQILFVNSQPPV